MLKPLTRLLTKNLQRIPLLRIDFDYKRYLRNGAKGSCDCVIHPCLKDDKHIINTMNQLCDYIRNNYDMDKII